MAPTDSTAHERRAHVVAPAGRALGLGGLPVELIERILRCFDDVRDLAAANATSRLFRGAPGGRSPVEHALRERARARGHARALPTALPPSACSWADELLARECVDACTRAHSAVVACGYNFSAFVDAEGGLHTCGEEEDDETGEPRARAALGHGAAHADVVCGPMRVAALSDERVRAVAAGGHHLLALSEAGAVYGCGSNDYGQLGLGDKATRHSFQLIDGLTCDVVACIAAGAVHSLALTAAGCAYGWGNNICGQLGHGDTKQRCEPTRVEALDGVRIGGLAAGGVHTLLLSTSGAAYSCGDGKLGRLGHGDEEHQLTPRRIEALAGVRAVHVSAGALHSLVVDASGGVHTFGGGLPGCLGHGDGWARLLPKRVEALSGVVHVARACGGRDSSAVLGADGSVHTFGTLPGRADRVRLPTLLHALTHVRVVDCALNHTHAVFATADGGAHSCGEPCAALGRGLRRLDDEAEAEAEALGAEELVRPVRIDGLPPLAAGGKG